ncbi:MAG: hypothetical protein JO317_03155 [Verrucomicrobiae bacterium]|nr:hypothetical protein [Verrucomicrobiae bacterium]
MFPQTHGSEPVVPPLGILRVVISPNGHWIGLCTSCHKLLRQTLDSDKAVLTCPSCRSSCTMRMDVLLDEMLKAKSSSQKIVLNLSAFG